MGLVLVLVILSQCAAINLFASTFVLVEEVKTISGPFLATSSASVVTSNQASSAATCVQLPSIIVNAFVLVSVLEHAPPVRIWTGFPMLSREDVVTKVDVCSALSHRAPPERTTRYHKSA